MDSIKEVFGILLVITSIFDALKYSLQASKIRNEKTARSMSRKFINFALVNDFVKLGYGFVIWDWFIVSSAALALICMIDLYCAIYVYYPYRRRGLNNFKRPNIFKYIGNSLLPNRLRKKL